MSECASRPKFSLRGGVLARLFTSCSADQDGAQAKHGHEFQAAGAAIAGRRRARR